MLTETSNPQTENLDQMDSLSIVRLMNAEDRKVIDAVQKVLPQVAQAVDAVVTAFCSGGRLIYSGAGTSGRLGLLDAVECVPTFGVSSERVVGLIAGGERAFVRAVEGAEDDYDAGEADLRQLQLGPKDVVVGIAASGRTPYVLGAVAYARRNGSATVGIACNDPAPLLNAVDIPIGLVVGAEVLTGSTRLKAGTAQKMVLNMISTAAFAQLGKVYGNLMVDVQATNEKLVQRAVRIISQITGLDEDISRALLHKAQKNVKVAVVMHYQQVDYNEALQILADANGYLRDAIAKKSSA